MSLRAMYLWLLAGCLFCWYLVALLVKIAIVSIL